MEKSNSLKDLKKELHRKRTYYSQSDIHKEIPLNKLQVYKPPQSQLTYFNIESDKKCDSAMEVQKGDDSE